MSYVTTCLVIEENGTERVLALGELNSEMARFYLGRKITAVALACMKNAEEAHVGNFQPVLGERNKASKLKARQVVEIRRRLAAGDSSLGVNVGHAGIPY